MIGPNNLVAQHYISVLLILMCTHDVFKEVCKTQNLMIKGQVSRNFVACICWIPLPHIIHHHHHHCCPILRNCFLPNNIMKESEIPMNGHTRSTICSFLFIELTYKHNIWSKIYFIFYLLFQWLTKTLIHTTVSNWKL